MQKAGCKDVKGVFASQDLGTHQGRVEEPGGHLSVPGCHAQVAEEIELGSRGPRTLLSGVDLRAHLLQKVTPILVFQKY